MSLFYGRVCLETMTNYVDTLVNALATFNSGVARIHLKIIGNCIRYAS